MTNGRKRDCQRFLSGQISPVRLLRSWGIAERSSDLILLLRGLQSAHSVTVRSRHRDFVKSVLKSYRLNRISRKTAARLLGCDPERLSVLLSLSGYRKTTRIRRLRSRAAEVLGSGRAADEWMGSPVQALGGLTPLAHAARHGSEELFRILGRIEHGVFS
jgi:hypothetical protein